MTVPEFKNNKLAFAWLGRNCTLAERGNYRQAYITNSKSMNEYKTQMDNSTGTAVDEEVTIKGRTALIGFDVCPTVSDDT